MAGSVFTAAQFNQYVRDNLNETGPAIVTAAGQYLVSDAANSLAARAPGTALVSASEATTATSYGSLTTAGPSVTATTGVAALVGVYCGAVNNGTGSSLMSFAISGATSVSAADNFGIGPTAGSQRAGALFLVSGLTAGSNVFTAQYRVTNNTGTFVDRRMLVIPL